VSDDDTRRVVAEFRANGGRVGGELADTPLLLLHHVGARSGIERVTPLAYVRRGDDHVAVVASNGGSARHPSWYYNLIADPRIEVELGTDRFLALAEALSGPARAALWPDLVAAAPTLGVLDAETARELPVFILTRAA